VETLIDLASKVGVPRSISEIQRAIFG
jgi:hypothetical protein